MSATLLISLRETLEASLVVGIVLTVLSKTENRQHHWIAWSGVAAGTAMSLLLAVLLRIFAGGLTGRNEEIYEGVTMLLAAGLITWMILWLLTEGKTLHRAIEAKTHLHLDRGHLLGIFLLTFLGVLREGVEIVIFFQATVLQSQSAFHHLGAIMGMVTAVAATWLLMRGMATWFSLRSFFSVTSVLLILFAAGLVAHGIHELQEAALLPFLTGEAWNTAAVLSENGILGSLLKGLFGYNANPSWLEVMAYAGYLTMIAYVWKRRSTSR